jgi:hypothetical protein
MHAILLFLCRRAEQKGAPAAEDEEVVEVGGSTLLEDPDAQPADLDDVLRAFYENDRCLDMEGRPVSFTELLLGKDYDLQHPALEPGYVPVENVGVPGKPPPHLAPPPSNPFPPALTRCTPSHHSINTSSCRAPGKSISTALT